MFYIHYVQKRPSLVMKSCRPWKSKLRSVYYIIYWTLLTEYIITARLRNFHYHSQNIELKNKEKVHIILHWYKWPVGCRIHVIANPAHYALICIHYSNMLSFIMYNGWHIGLEKGIMLWIAYKIFRLPMLKKNKLKMQI